MSGTESTPPPATNWIGEHLQRYLASGGTDGHMFDFGPMNGAGLQPNCLIRHKGRKSGRTLILPLIYGMVAGEFVLVASKGGAPTHPAWYLNITAASEVDIQIATQAYRATWREPSGEERQRLWDQMVAIYPPYAEYQQATDREIPLLVLKPVAEIPVFTAADLAG